MYDSNDDRMAEKRNWTSERARIHLYITAYLTTLRPCDVQLRKMQGLSIH